MNTLSTFRASVAVVGLFLVGSTAAATGGGQHPAARRTPAVAAAPALSTCCGEAAPPAPEKKAATLAPAAALPAVAPGAPQTVQLQGIVLNPDGRPCAGASVYAAGAPRQLVVTDAKGAFALPVLAGGAVSLRVEYFGVGSSRVEVPAPGTAPVHVVLGQ